MAEEKRGLASADEKTREEVARKGGEAVSQDREHMAEIGRKGGETVSKDREHMAEIGRKVGDTSYECTKLLWRKGSSGEPNPL